MKYILLTLLISACLNMVLLAQNNQSAALEEAVRLHIQVVKLYQEQKYDEALPLAKRVISLREKELGKEHELLAPSLINLAMIYQAKQDYHQAESALRRAVRIREKVAGENSPQLTDSLIKLAWLDYAIGNTREAESLFTRAIAICEKAFGPDSPQTELPLQYLASLYQKTSKPDKAIPLWQRIIASREKNLGENHRDVAQAMEQCACALAQNRKDKEAWEMWRKARNIFYGIDQMGVTEEVLKGSALVRVQPVYPQAAKQLRISGAVLIQVKIDEAGLVSEAKILCGPDIISEAALEAARKWTFKPTLLADKPIKVEGILTFNFTLQ